MVKTLEDAIAQISGLPDADQEQIGRKLLAHVDKLRRLRSDIDAGLRSLDAGQGSSLDVDALLRDMNERHGKA